MSKVYIEKRENGAAVYKYIGKNKELIAAFEQQSDGTFTRTYSKYVAFPKTTFDSIKSIREYYGVRKTATVYYEFDLDENIIGYAIDLNDGDAFSDCDYDRRYKTFPITRTTSGDVLVPEKLLIEMAALTNQDYEVTLLY